MPSFSKKTSGSPATVVRMKYGWCWERWDLCPERCLLQHWGKRRETWGWTKAPWSAWQKRGQATRSTRTDAKITKAQPLMEDLETAKTPRNQNDLQGHEKEWLDRLSQKSYGWRKEGHHIFFFFCHKPEICHGFLHAPWFSFHIYRSSHHAWLADRIFLFNTPNFSKIPLCG